MKPGIKRRLIVVLDALWLVFIVPPSIARGDWFGLAASLGFAVSVTLLLWPVEGGVSET